MSPNLELQRIRYRASSDRESCERKACNGGHLRGQREREGSIERWRKGERESEWRLSQCLRSVKLTIEGSGE